MRDDRKALVLVVFVWALSVAFWFSPGITKPDGVGYYVYLPSLALDGDLLFFNEWDRFGLIDRGLIRHKEVTATNHLGNHWTVGSALLWGPSFAAARLLRLLPPLDAFPPDGVSLPFNVAVGFTSAVAGLLTLLIGYRIARLSEPVFPAVVAALAVWFGTPLLFYSIRNPIMSHAPSALACALVVFMAIRLRSDGRQVSWFVTGLAAGFAFIVRPQNGTFALIPFLIAAASGRPLGERVAIFGCGFVVAALPQFVVSSFLYGNPFGFLTGGGAARPFAAFERVWVWEPILSWYHGLIPWSPVVALAIAGLGLLWRRDRGLALAGFYAIGTQWLVNATLERSFWGAWAFGQRRFDNCTVFFVIGTAALLAGCPRWAQVTIAGITSLWTMSIFFAASGPLDLGLYYTPGELFAMQKEALLAAGSHFDFLGAVPAVMKPSVALLLASMFVLAALVTLMIYAGRRGGTPAAAWVVSAAFALAAFTLCIAGFTGRSRVAHFGELIDFNRTVSSALGGADARMGLLRDEARYLRKSGRIREAEQTERELAELESMRREGMDRLRAMGIAK